MRLWNPGKSYSRCQQVEPCRAGAPTGQAAAQPPREGSPILSLGHAGTSLVQHGEKLVSGIGQQRHPDAAPGFGIFWVNEEFQEEGSRSFQLVMENTFDSGERTQLCEKDLGFPAFPEELLYPVCAASSGPARKAFDVVRVNHMTWLTLRPF